MKIPNKHISTLFFGLLLAISLQLLGAPRVFASTRQATIFLPNSARAALVIPRGPRLRWPSHFLIRRQEDNQSFQACASNTANKYYWGHNQGNSGNHGFNSGLNEDDSSNNTNQIIMQNPFSHRRINQSFQICVEDSSNLHYAGAVQGNSGNNGLNVGVNQDDSSNVGNQIIG